MAWTYLPLNLARTHHRIIIIIIKRTTLSGQESIGIALCALAGLITKRLLNTLKIKKI